MEKCGSIDTDSDVLEPDNFCVIFLEAEFRSDAPVTRFGDRIGIVCIWQR